jgi:hypothetical protein
MSKVMRQLGDFNTVQSRDEICNLVVLEQDNETPMYSPKSAVGNLIVSHEKMNIFSSDSQIY